MAKPAGPASSRERRAAVRAVNSPVCSHCGRSSSVFRKRHGSAAITWPSERLGDPRVEFVWHDGPVPAGPRSRSTPTATPRWLAIHLGKAASLRSLPVMTAMVGLQEVTG